MKIKKITVQLLEEHKACYEGIEWFESQEETDPIKLLESLIATDDPEKIEFANWSIVRLMTRKQYISYAVFAAEQVIDIFEKECPEDKRPREAIEAAKVCIHSNTKKNRAAARDAARAARDAAGAARDAARDAAWAAAGDARDAAWAAAWAAARAAARAAAWDARAAMKKRIVQNGIDLLEGRVNEGVGRCQRLN